MNPPKTIPALLAIVLVLAGCNDGNTTVSTTATSTTVSEVSTSTRVGESGTTTTVEGRGLDLVDCDHAADEVVIVCEAYDLIMENYVDDVDASTLVDAAERGLEMLDGADSDDLLVCATPTDAFDPVCDLAAGKADDSAEAAAAMVNGFTSFALDPNSAYLDEDALELLQEEQQGQIEGIGALVSPEDQTIPGDNKQCGIVSDTCQILIVSTITGSPADAAGLMRNDVLVEVNGESIFEWTVDEVTAAVRGPAGTDVTLTLLRDGDEVEVTITRAAVVIPVVESQSIGDIGYVSLASFSGSAGDQFQEAVVDRLADGVDELVIDLRNNPGGFLTTAIEVASVFLEDGDVVVTQGPKESTSYEVNGSAVVPRGMPVYMVVNKGSASASEVVAATLQERERAQIVGENTFGKNTVQQRFGLSNDGALKLTIARWLTPGGHDFGGTGVTPDVELDVNGLTPEELVAAVTGTAA